MQMADRECNGRSFNLGHRNSRNGKTAQAQKLSRRLNFDWIKVQTK